MGAGDPGIRPLLLIAPGKDLLQSQDISQEGCRGQKQPRPAEKQHREIPKTNGDIGIVAHFIDIPICSIYENLLLSGTAGLR